MNSAALLIFLERYWRIIVPAVLLALLLVGGGLLWYCGKSATEKRIENRNPVRDELDRAVNTANAIASNANATAANASKEAEAAKQIVNGIVANKQTNVSITEANRSRCLAFPDSAECK